MQNIYKSAESFTAISPLFISYNYHHNCFTKLLIFVKIALRCKMRIYYKNNYISVLIIFVMLLCGMCQKDFLTDSLFSFRQDQPQRSAYSSIGSLPDSPVLCTEELLGKPVLLTAFRRTGRTEQNWKTRISSLMPGMPLCPVQSRPLIFTARSRFSYRILSITIILHYIHHQDGQKS